MTKRNENRPGYKKTKVGWIPEEWECKLIKSVAKINPSKTSLVYNNKVDFIAMEDISTSGKLINKKEKEYSEVSNGYTCFREGDILVAKITPCFENGKGAIAEGLINKVGFGSTEFHVIRPQKVNAKYIFLITQSSIFRKRGEINMTGSAGQKRVPKNFIETYSIPYPPMNEQAKIAEILSAWDRAIGQTCKLLEAKKRLKKGLIQQLLTGRMRFPGFGVAVEKVGDLPVDWQILRAKEIFKKKSIKNHNNAPVLSVTQDQGVVPRDSLDRKINMSTEKTDTYKLVEPGDYVISLRSFQGGLEYSGLRGLVSPAYHVISPRKEINTDFYKHYFKSYRFIGHLAIAVIGIRDGKQISFNDFSFMKIPYPSPAEQRRIAEVLDACDLELKQIENKRAALERQKQGLMQKLLTGEVRVNL